MRTATLVRRCLSFCLAALLSACGGGGGGSGTAPPPPPPPTAGPVFTFEGLDGSVVTKLYLHDDRLFAGTRDGLFTKALGGNNWQLVALDDFEIVDIAFVDANHWLASTYRITDTNREMPLLLETVNGGSNWLEVTHDFGDGSPDPERMFALFYDAAGQRLLATGTNALASSDDFGRTWQLLQGTWATFANLDALALHPVTGEVWVGGQNSIEEMILRRIDPASGNATDYPRLLPSPATIKGITFDPVEPGRIIASGEGGVLQTVDDGATWTNLLGDVDHRFYFRAVLDPANRNRMLTVGWDKNTDLPQPLIVEVSNDRGATWTRHQHGNATLFGGAWSLLAVREQGETVLYVGLFQGGVFRVSF